MARNQRHMVVRSVPTNRSSSRSGIGNRRGGRRHHVAPDGAALGRSSARSPSSRGLADGRAIPSTHRRSATGACSPRLACLGRPRLVRGWALSASVTVLVAGRDETELFTGRRLAGRRLAGRRLTADALPGAVGGTADLGAGASVPLPPADVDRVDAVASHEVADREAGDLGVAPPLALAGEHVVEVERLEQGDGGASGRAGLGGRRGAGRTVAPGGWQPGRRRARERLPGAVLVAGRARDEVALDQPPLPGLERPGGGPGQQVRRVLGHRGRGSAASSGAAIGGRVRRPFATAGEEAATVTDSGDGVREGPDARDRLVAALGGDDLAWLRARVRERLARGEMPAAGIVSLAAPMPAQRAAVARLLGRRPGTGGALRVDLAQVSEVLRRAGIAADVGAAVIALEGPVADRAAARAAEERAWADAAAPLRQLAAERPALAPWVDRVQRTGLVRRLAVTPDAGQRLAEDAAAVVRLLPASGVSLARFAHAALGRAHALDAGRPVETLARGAAEALVGPPSLDGLEGRRETWAEVGVLVDDLTTQVLVLGLRSTGAGAVDRILDAAARVGEPAVLPLGMLARHPPDLPGYAGRVVSVCENVTVVAAAAEALGPRCAALVCARGQPTVAVLRLLDLLRARDAVLRYHGDFDWPGVRIGDRVLRRFAARPWRFGGADYRRAAAHASATAPLVGAPVDASWDPSLRTAMEDLGVAVEEEAVVDDLVEDLAVDAW